MNKKIPIAPKCWACGSDNWPLTEKEARQRYRKLVTLSDGTVMHRIPRAAFTAIKSRAQRNAAVEKDADIEKTRRVLAAAGLGATVEQRIASREKRKESNETKEAQGLSSRGLV